MSQFRQGGVLVLIILAVIAFVSGCPDQSITQTNPVSGILGTVTAEGARGNQLNNVLPEITEVPLANQWELIEFVQEAYLLGSERRDLGTFRNLESGEIIQAYCEDPTAPNPIPRSSTIQGDTFFFNNEGKLERVDGEPGQTFQRITFQIVEGGPTQPSDILNTVTPTETEGQLLQLSTTIPTTQNNNIPVRGVRIEGLVLWLLLALVVIFVAFIAALVFSQKR